ncbi:hydrogen gas-evolving membrane-bound hydrogenase subunit E [Haloglomus litoreum]|uniref:hydrogen gas-evolving membrane-bound hydrogenase subunit E n=1 Tax=Haloglomus litoreum TaxID=3034026 RepID=UPI0023E8B013|nr:hydrogen gas-evolving membrane-bound hydrogenase subunit E [Haloglomus sp. DT116]
MQPDAGVLVAALALPFVAALLVPALFRVLGQRVAFFAALVAAASFGLLATQYGAEGAVQLPWIPSLGVTLTLYVDGLALLIGFLASGVGVLVFTYSYGYMAHEHGHVKYYATLLAFMGSMLGVAFAADLLALFVFWELTSVTSFLLIGHHQREAASQYAARKSMLITVAGGLFMLAGFLVLAFASGDTAAGRTFVLIGTENSLIANGDAVREALRASSLFVPALALVAVGAVTKSAQAPFHVWLPNAMEAPTPVSAFLHSATMVKAGVYLVGRFRPLFVPDLPAIPEWTLLLATLGLVSMTITAILAVGATDIKELLAYSTASHLGLIIAGYGLAGSEALELGAETGAFHIFNHAVFKATLFLVAGIIAHEAHTRKISELGGLRKDLPIVAGITGIAALGMAGVPPFNGFWSKELLFETTYYVAKAQGGWFWLYPAIAVFGSVFTFLYSLKFLSLFFGDRPDALADVDVHRPPLSMLAPPALLAAIAIVAGVVPQVAIDAIVQSAFEASVPVGVEAHSLKLSIPKLFSFTPYLGMSLLTIALGGVAYPFYDRLHAGVRRARAVDYTSPNWYYDGLTEGANGVSRRLAIAVHGGAFRTYAAPFMLGTSVLALAGYAAAGAVTVEGVGAVPPVPLVLVLGVAVVGAMAVARAPSHIAGVLTLSILGFMVAIVYILAHAPDLALTQLVIETLVLVIFLLVLDKLPAYYGEIRSRARTVADAALASLVGFTVFATVIVATSAQPDGPIFEFFLARAGVPAEHGPIFGDYGGGSNVVNVILVDFRAFDTLGEISVVAMAALSVLTLIGMRARTDVGGDDPEVTEPGGRGPEESPVTDGGATDVDTTEGGEAR